MEFLLNKDDSFVYFDEKTHLYYDIKEVCACESAFNESAKKTLKDENINAFIFFIEVSIKNYHRFLRVCPALIRSVGDTVRLYGIASYDGLIIMKPKYNSLSIKGKFLFGQIGPLKGVFSIDMNHFELCDETYENRGLYRKVLNHCFADIVGPFCNDIAFFIKDQKLGVINKNGKICIPCNYEIYDEYNICKLNNLSDNIISLINENGTYDHFFISPQTGIKHILNSNYKEVHQLCKNPTCFYAININNVISLLNDDFITLTEEYDSIQSIYCTHYLLVRKNNQYGIIKYVPNNITIIVDCIYQQLVIDRRTVSGEQFYAMAKRNNEYGIISNEGKVVMNFISLPNDLNILPYTFGEGYVGVEKHTVIGAYKITDVFFINISDYTRLCLRGQCTNLEINHIISGFKNGKAEVIHFLMEGEREGCLCRDIIDFQGRILKREPIEEEESILYTDYDDYFEYTEKDTWYAMTDGMYGDMPDEFDGDYYFLGY